MTAGNLTVGSFNLTAGSGTYSIRNNTSGANNSTLTLGGEGNLGNGVSGSSTDLLYAAAGGTFNIRGDNASGTGTLFLALGQNGTFNIAGTSDISAIITGAGFGFTKTGAGNLTLSGNNTHTGTSTVSSGTLRLNSTNALQNSTLDTGSSGSQTVTFAVAGNNTYNLGGLSGSDDLSLAANSISVGANNADTSYSGVISGTGGLTKTGAGNFTLTGANTYSGATTINTGTLQLGNGGASGNLSTSSAITVNGTLAFNRNADVIQGTNFSNAAITGTGSLIQNGGGGSQLLLNAANTYAGGTTLNSGTLNINNASAIGSGTLTINGGTLNSNSASAVTLSTNNAQIWNGNFAFTGTRDLNLGIGAVTMNASRNIAVNGGNLTVGGVIQGSSFGITKTGSGTLRLSGTNTYTGATTIDSGTLAVDGSLASDSSVFVNSGGTLAGNGTVNGLATLNAGANLAPGNGVGSLNFTNGLTLNSTSIVTMEINGDSTFDTISVTGGNLAYGGNLNLVFGYIPAVSSNFTLFTGGSVASSTGNLTLNFTSNPGFDGTFDPSNGKLTLTAVPEPKTLLMLALGASFLLWRARGRRLER